MQYSVEGVANEEDVLDYGVLSESDISSKIFTVHNVNPVEVSLALQCWVQMQVACSCEWALIRVAHCGWH